MTAKRSFGFALLGVLLVQAAWMLVMPPFGGMDEHEHAYKAAAVAHGDWSATHELSPKGWGEFVRVPPSLAEAAQPQCAVLKYVSPDSCDPGPVGSDGLVRIATSAARYNPAYYALVGPATLVVDGYSALYTMRVVSGALCAVLIAAAFVIGSSRSRWHGLAVLLTLTPTTLYATAIIAPNGLEIAAAILLWACVLALRPDDLTARAQSRLVAVATLASVPLIVLRTLGPLWWVLIVGLAMVLFGRRRTVALARTRAVRLAAVPIALAGSCAVAWDLAARTNTVPSATIPVTAADWKELPTQYVAWFFQSVAAMPFRNQLVPLGVYVAFFFVVGTLIAVAVKRATNRERVVLAVVFVLASGIGLAVTVVAMPHVGFLWQGRYFLPLTIGFFFVVCHILSRAPAGSLLAGRLPAAVTVVVVAATHMISLIHVLHLESTSPLAGTGHWLEPRPWLLVLLTVGGAALLAAATLRNGERAVIAPGGTERELVAFATQ